ncbi:MAG: ATP-dependent 6-phosphofructokinase [Gemmatimonadetes bacterium]|nr:ATP-dependent 6-phosphofructokinase [Gemmatimonadota bacterium]
MRIAINTGGGDAPGLNAVIRAASLSALNLGWEVVGIRRGYQGLFEEDGLVPLTRGSVRGITHTGGTILGTTNRGNPLQWPVEGPDGSIRLVDRSEEVVSEFKRRGLDALIAIGGDGSLRIASKLSEKGLPVVGVPKTIDNDLAATQVTFGFHTAVETATDAISKLHSTAEAHSRVMIVEVMGRGTGWIALYAGLAGTADVILIPEIPYRLDSVCERIDDRYEGDVGFAIVVAAEGAFPEGGDPVLAEKRATGKTERFGGIADQLANEIGERTGRETRSLALRHLQRGGQPNAYDRLLALQFGSAAINLVQDGHFGCMVALDPPNVLAVPLAEAVAEIRQVPLDGDVVRTARSLGISFGD